MRKYLTIFITSVVVGIIATSALAGPIKVWSGSEYITAADLNANFTHIHGTMVGGHGARLVDADVNANAAIAHSKLATPGVIAKSIFTIGSGTTGCSAGTCTLTGTAGVVPTVTFNTTGNYTITLPAARTDANWFLTATPRYCGAATAGCYCSVQSGVSTTTATIQCFSVTSVGPVINAVNAVVGVAIWDDNN